MPRVSIGMPVYNGQRYLAQAIESILGQTWRDFELLISDNASTDRTEAICREFAARDARVQYHRLPENLGLARNFNRVFELSGGEYFKWAAHDDLLEPRYLEACVAALDAAGVDAVMAYPLTRYVDENGATLYSERSLAGITFAQLLDLPASVIPIFIHGLIRRDALLRTRLLGAFVSSDVVLARELRLLGRFIEVPEELFIFRHHSPQSVDRRDRRSKRGETAYIDPAAAEQRVMPSARVLKETLKAIRRTPMSPAARLARYASVGRLAAGRLARKVLSGSVVGWLRRELSRDAVFYGNGGKAQ